MKGEEKWEEILVEWKDKPMKCISIIIIYQLLSILTYVVMIYCETPQTKTIPPHIVESTVDCFVL